MADPPRPVEPILEQLNQALQELSESDLPEVGTRMQYLLAAIEMDAPLAPAAAEAAHQADESATHHQHRGQAPPDLLRQTAPLVSPSSAECIETAARSPGQQVPEDTFSVSTAAGAAAPVDPVTATVPGAAGDGVVEELLGACRGQEQSDLETTGKEQQVQAEKEKEQEQEEQEEGGGEEEKGGEEEEQQQRQKEKEKQQEEDQEKEEEEEEEEKEKKEQQKEKERQEEKEQEQQQQQEEEQERIAVELITPERVQELIEVGRTTGEGFRELIRYLGRTLSNPACVSTSFSLVPRPQGTTGVASPQPTPALPSIAGGGSVACDDETVAKPDAPSNATGSATSATSDVESAMVNVNRNVKALSAIDVAGAAGAVGSPAAAIATKESSPSCQGWADRSQVGMDVAAAAEVWKLLRKLDSDNVAGAVLFALEALTQELYMQSYLEMGGEGESEVTAATAAATTGATSTTAAAEGGVVEVRAGVNGDGEGNTRERADLRAIVLGECLHPFRAAATFFVTNYL